MSEKIRDAAKQAVSEQGNDDATSDNLDSCRLIPQDDFRKIDTAALPPSKLLGIAFNEITLEDFNKADLDGNQKLSVNELSSAVEEQASPIKKAAFDILKRAVVEHSKDPRGVIGRTDVRGWHKLDSRFSGFDSNTLTDAAKGSGPLSEAAAVEKVRRADMAVPESVSDLVPKIQLMQNALKREREIETDPDGKFVLSETPLSSISASEIISDLTDTLFGLSDQVKSRNELSMKLFRSEGNIGRSVHWAEEALQKSDTMRKKFGTAGGAVSVADLAMRQLNMGDYSSKLEELILQPVGVRLDLAAMSIGWNGNSALTIDTSSPNFLPDKAERLANEAKEILCKEIYRIDPTDSRYSNRAVLGGSWSDLDPKGKLNFYRDSNRDGKVDLFQDLRKRKLQNAR